MAPKPINQNVLFYGDNLPILREHFQDESIDLIYLDPPFNSNRSYNVLFKGERVQMPPAHGTFKKAERVKKPGGSQGELDI
jgi:adenine specific DNA methylase Mod